MGKSAYTEIKVQGHGIVTVANLRRDVRGMSGITNMMHDKRTRRRIPFQRPIRITTEDGEKTSLMCMDFSMEGIGFQSTEPRDVGEIIRVSLNIGHNGRTHILDTIGEVVHRHYKDKKFFVGMRFYKNS